MGVAINNRTKPKSVCPTLGGSLVSVCSHNGRLRTSPCSRYKMLEGGSLTKTSVMKVEEGKNTTVQGLGTPVPAVESEQAGSQASISSNCNVTTVDDLAAVTAMTTRNTNENRDNVGLSHQAVNPFDRRSMLSRTPPTTNKTENNTMNSAIVQQNKENSAMPQQINEPRVTTKAMDEYERTLTVLGEKIKELSAFVKDRNNVHHQIKDLVRSIRTSFNKINESTVPKSNPAQGKATQTSPTSGPGPSIATPKRSRIISPEQLQTEAARKLTKKMRPNRKAEDPRAFANATPKTPNVSAPKETNDKKAPTISQLSQRLTPSTPAKQKKLNKKTQPRKSTFVRPDAFIIKQTGNLSYADMLKKIKESSNLHEMGSKVQKIRRTQAGELIIIMDKTASGKCPEFQTALRNTLDHNAEVKTRTHEILIEVRDLDEVATGADILSAIQEQHSVELTSAAIKSLRVAYGGTQSALLSLPVSLGMAILSRGRLRVGWVVCRVREKKYPTKCFKCWGMGHLARNCTSEIDRTGVCIKCGQKGHHSKNCSNEPKCVLCTESGAQNNEHMLGSRRCPAYTKKCNENGSG